MNAKFIYMVILVKIMNFIVKWIVVPLLVIFALFPLFDMVVNGYNSLKINFTTPLDIASLGQLGDFFGGHTAAFSGLVSTVLILYFSSKQLSLQQTQFKEQVKISKQTADLSSLNNIYQHYGEGYGKDCDVGDILKSVAEGHRRWVIRESFSIIDPEGALELHRKKQVDIDHNKLIKLLQVDDISEQNIREISMLTSSLLLDKRLGNKEREMLWNIYELIRVNPQELITEGSSVRDRFESERNRFRA